MTTDTLKFQFDALEKDLKTWQERFKKDNQDRWFVHYTSMSDRIKEKATVNLLPAIEEFKSIKHTYGEKYRIKDINYHIDVALTSCEQLRVLLKEIHTMYKNQAEYEKIRLTWNVHFSTFFRRIQSVRERIYILDRILAKENAEAREAA